MLAPMKDRWRQLDLQGGGLQAANQTYVARMKRRRVAYGLWLLFPLGLHRAYLEDRRGNLAYVAATVTALGAWLAGVRPVWEGAIVLSLIFALHDLWWIDRRVTELNKALRMAVSLGTGAAPPPGFRGREVDPEATLEAYRRAKEAERPAEREVGRTPSLGGQHVPSFMEQERLLRELAKAKRRRKDAQSETRS